MKETPPPSLCRRVARSSLVVLALLATCAALFLAANPRLTPGDLLAPFVGRDGATGNNGLNPRFCRSHHECASLDAPPGSGQWFCRGHSCTWRADPRLDCERGGTPCPTGMACDVSGCDQRRGMCVRIPEGCDDRPRPVCGCPRTGYSDDCARLASGAALRADAPCATLCYGVGERFDVPSSWWRRLVSPDAECCAGLQAVPDPINPPCPPDGPCPDALPGRDPSFTCLGPQWTP